MSRSTQLSRRGFAQLLGTGAAYAAMHRSFVLSMPLRKTSVPAPTTGIVRLSSNENPYGPSPAALKAMSEAFSLAWRYPDEHADILGENLARLHDVTSDQVMLGNGSSEILKLAAATFTGPDRRLVIADPTFEAIARYAKTARAEVIKVSLTPDYRHDLAKMMTYTKVGLVYVCNPNNPTASITPKSEIRSFLAQIPPTTTVLVDEAYHHYVESPDYESVIGLVKHHSNLIVARTFSKIYGMAGLRCGYCIAHPTIIRQLREQQPWDNVNIMALMAANASLPDKTYVEQGKQRNSDTRKYVYGELEKLSLRFIPSHANFLMIDLQRPARPIIAALAERKVEVGRVFPSLPNFLRVTIGTRTQMETFISEFRQVMV
ncbi:MAG TPA: histidinol-phosphate transaminase [Pyrinomonadaceae bacterium]|nr:histidinol-phosphate transaminase [Pyrinomonadaceae bacterium]